MNGLAGQSIRKVIAAMSDFVKMWEDTKGFWLKYKFKFPYFLKFSDTHIHHTHTYLLTRYALLFKCVFVFVCEYSCVTEDLSPRLLYPKQALCLGAISQGCNNCCPLFLWCWGWNPVPCTSYESTISLKGTFRSFISNSLREFISVTILFLYRFAYWEFCFVLLFVVV